METPFTQLSTRSDLLKLSRWMSSEHRTWAEAAGALGGWLGLPLRRPSPGSGHWKCLDGDELRPAASCEQPKLGRENNACATVQGRSQVFCNELPITLSFPNKPWETHIGSLGFQGKKKKKKGEICGLPSHTFLNEWTRRNGGGAHKAKVSLSIKSKPSALSLRLLFFSMNKIWKHHLKKRKCLSQVEHC